MADLPIPDVLQELHDQECPVCRTMLRQLPPLRLGYTAATLERYAAAKAAEERARVIKIIEAYRVPVGNSAAGEMACDWTLEALREIRAAIRGTEAASRGE